MLWGQVLHYDICGIVCYTVVMARPLRIEYAGALYHITSRGDRRESIYEDDDDRKTFLSVLESVVERFGWLCHGYCLMGNHYHLLVETPRPNLSRGMRQLNGVYTQRFNRSHGRVGHVFQGRFKGIVIEKENHLLEVCRYIVLNPVRAGMVEHPRQWRWSSYRATAGLREPPGFLSTDWILSQFGKRRADAQREYRRFVREGLGKESPWESLAGGLLLGSEKFVARCRGLLSGNEELSEIPRQQKYLGRPPLSALFDGIGPTDKKNRNAAMASAYLEHGYTMTSIAEFLSLHYVTVSRAVSTYEKEMS